MKKAQTKRIIALLLSFMMIFSIIPAPIFASENEGAQQETQEVIDPQVEEEVQEGSEEEPQEEAQESGTEGGATTVAVSGITVNSDSSGVKVGESLQLTATITPEEATDKTVTWSVENGTGEATIDGNGLLTGVKEGTVTVKATANDGSGVVGEKKITIYKPGETINVSVWSSDFKWKKGEVFLSIYIDSDGNDLILPSDLTPEEPSEEAFNGECDIDLSKIYVSRVSGNALKLKAGYRYEEEKYDFSISNIPITQDDIDNGGFIFEIGKTKESSTKYNIVFEEEVGIKPKYSVYLSYQEYIEEYGYSDEVAFLDVGELADGKYTLPNPEDVQWQCWGKMEKLIILGLLNKHLKDGDIRTIMVPIARYYNQGKQ